MSEQEPQAPSWLLLDDAYVKEAGTALAHYLRRDRPVELAYTPGNGTLYELVFTSAGGLASATHEMDHVRGRSIKQDRPEFNHEEESMLVLSWIGHGAMPLDLRRLPVDSYLGEKFHECTLGDAAALRQLLLSLSEAMGFRSLAIVR